MTALELLTTARGYIANRVNWTTGIRKIGSRDRGFAYCALGAIDEALEINWAFGPPSEAYPKPYREAIRALFSVLEPHEQRKAEGYYRKDQLQPLSYVAGFNNNSSHAEVLSMFDRAIAKLSNERTQLAVDYIKAQALEVLSDQGPSAGNTAELISA